MSSRAILFVAALLFSSSLFAQDVPYSIAPAGATTAGRVQVTVKGNFGTWPYGLIFAGTLMPPKISP